MKRVYAFVAALIFSILPAMGEEKVTEATAILNRVAKEGRGNDTAQVAWKSLAKFPADAIPDILAAFQKDNFIGQNWLRLAINSIVEKTKKAGTPLPLKALQKFLDNKANLPEARALAFEILLSNQANAKDLIPGFLDDPGAELRRMGVAYWQEKGMEAKKAGKKEDATKILKKCFSRAADQDQVDALAKELKTLGETIDIPGHYGFIQTWNVTGAFDSTGGKGFNIVYPPEEKVDLAASYTGKGGEKFGWKAFSTTHDHGQMDLNKLIGKKKDCLAYAFTKITTPHEGEAYIRAGCITALKVWVNSKQVYAREEYHHGMSLDQHIVPIQLKKGENTLLLKICQNNQTDSWAQKWEYMTRLTDAAGFRITFKTEKAGGE